MATIVLCTQLSPLSREKERRLMRTHVEKIKLARGGMGRSFNHHRPRHALHSCERVELVCRRPPRSVPCCKPTRPPQLSKNPRIRTTRPSDPDYAPLPSSKGCGHAFFWLDGAGHAGGTRVVGGPAEDVPDATHTPG